MAGVNPATGQWEEDYEPGDEPTTEPSPIPTPIASAPAGRPMPAPARPVAPIAPSPPDTLDTIGADSIAQIRAENQRRIEERQALAEGAQAEAAQRAQEAEEAQALRQRTQAEVARRRAAADAQEERARSMAPQSFWADKSTGDKVLAVVASFLGGIGATMQGHGAVNQASARLDKIIERDLALQQQKIAKAKEDAARARGGVADAMSAGDMEMDDLKTAGIAKRERLLADMKSQMAATGMKAAEIEGNGLVLKERQKLEAAKAERDMEIQKAAANVSLLEARAAKERARAAVGGYSKGYGLGGPEKPRHTVAADKNQALFDTAAPQIDIILNGPGISKEGARLISSGESRDKVLEKVPLLDAIGRYTGVVKETADRLPNETDKQYYQALQSLMDVANTYITGAGQSDSEFRRRFAKAKISEDDSPALKKQKATDLALLVRGIGKGGSTPMANEARLDAIESKKKGNAPATTAARPEKPRPDAKWASHPKLGGGWFYDGLFHPAGR